MNKQLKEQTEILNKRAKSALRTLFVADSIAMPVHWYYRTSDIYKEFPNGINNLEDAPLFHPSSIMSVHSKTQGGRKNLQTKNKKDIVGDVILKGKEMHWGQANRHYHHEMKAGENTLNAHCVRVLIQSIVDLNGQYDCRNYLENYISMMTANTPQHNDTYAESYHRGFFSNYINGQDIEKCAAITHDTASIGGLVSIGPLALFLLLQGHDIETVQQQCKKHLLTTHPDDFLAQVCRNYVSLIQKLLFRKNHESALEIIITTLNNSVKLKFDPLNIHKIEDQSIVGGKFSTACYITDSWPSVLFLASKYHNDIKAGILANANLGGDNVHRGAVLGFILGLANDEFDTYSEIRTWYTKLKDSLYIETEIKNLLNSI